MSTSIETSNPWVSVAFVQGDDYADIEDFGPEEMARQLAKHDLGEPTDENVYEGPPWGPYDRLYRVQVDGSWYVLAVDHASGCASLNRRPMSWLEEV